MTFVQRCARLATPGVPPGAALGEFRAGRPLALPSSGPAAPCSPRAAPRCRTTLPSSRRVLQTFVVSWRHWGSVPLHPPRRCLSSSTRPRVPLEVPPGGEDVVRRQMSGIFQHRGHHAVTGTPRSRGWHASCAWMSFFLAETLWLRSLARRSLLRWLHGPARRTRLSSTRRRTRFGRYLSSGRRFFTSASRPCASNCAADRR